MITDLEQYQNQIQELPSLEDVRYENIFKVAKTDKFFFYNIIKKISIMFINITYLVIKYTSKRKVTKKISVKMLKIQN